MQAMNSSSQLSGYVIGKTIGRGTFGKVKKGTHKLSGQTVAIKCLQKQKIRDITDVQRVSRQLHLLKIVRHPAIAQLYEIIETPKMIYIVMQFAEGGQYFEYVMDQKIKNQQQIFRYFTQIVSALSYLHRIRISHRDVKPQNMLLDSHGRIKLVDFGLSNMYGKGQKLSTACGSPCYASPQMIIGQDYDPQLTDVWSLGIVLYTSAMAKLPFQDQNIHELYSKIKAGSYIINRKISPQLKDLLGRLINTEPFNRISLKQIPQHPWYNKFNKRRQTTGIQIGYQNIPIDKDIVQKMQPLGFQGKKTVKYLQNNIKNGCTATYYLFLKRNFKDGKASLMDICSDGFQRISVAPSSNRRYKSFDLGAILSGEGIDDSARKININCNSQLKYRYSQQKDELQNNILSIKKSSLKSIDSKGNKSVGNFLRTRAEFQVKKRIFKNEVIRKPKFSVSNQKPKVIPKCVTQGVDSSKKGKNNKIVNNQLKIHKRMNTDFIVQIYGPTRKSKSKKENSLSKQKAKRNIIELDFGSVFWRKKSTKVKQNTGNSAQYTHGLSQMKHKYKDLNIQNSQFY